MPREQWCLQKTLSVIDFQSPESPRKIILASVTVNLLRYLEVEQGEFGSRNNRTLI